MTAAADYSLAVMAVIAAAGPIASRRALQGSAPGWRPVRSRLEITAIHESAHAVVCAALYKPPALTTIVPADESNGHMLFDDSPDGDGCLVVHRPISDAGIVRRNARSLAVLTGRDPLYVFRGLRAKAESLVEEHWYLISFLAGELLKHKTMRRSDIAAIVSPHIKRP